MTRPLTLLASALTLSLLGTSVSAAVNGQFEGLSILTGVEMEETIFNPNQEIPTVQIYNAVFVING